MCKARCLCRNALEDIVHEAVHYAHGFGADASVGMDLFQHFVDVDSIAFLPLTFLLLISFGDVLLCLPGLLRSFT